MDINIELLVKQIAYQENKKSFERLFFHFYDLLYSYAYSYLQNKEAAEEVISDVFLAIWQKRKTLHHINNIKVYLYVSVKNHAINYKKKYRRYPVLSVNEVSLYDGWQDKNPENQLLTKELKQEIDDAIDNLPHRCKIIFQLVRLDGLKYREVAEVLNISVKTVEKQVGIAIQKLKEQLHHHQIRKTRNKMSTGTKTLAIINFILAMF